MKRIKDCVIHHCYTVMFSHVSLTFSESVIDSEAAQDFIDISGVEETITSYHHLEGLWVKRSEAQI